MQRPWDEETGYTGPWWEDYHMRQEFARNGVLPMKFETTPFWATGASV